MSTGLIKTFDDLFRDRQLIGQFTAGRHDKDLRFTAEREYARQIIAKNDQLGRCSPESMRVALLEVAWSGLSLAPMLGHGYLIPYETTATFSPGYRGLIHLAYRSGMVKSVQAVRVMQADEFEVATRNNVRTIHHVEAPKARGPLLAVYVIAHLTNGGTHVDVTYADVIAAAEAQAVSRPKGGYAWKGKFRDQMELKVGIRRAWKHWPLDNAGQMQHALAVAAKHDDLDFGPDGDKDAPESEPCLTDTQQLELHALLTDNGLSADEADKWLKGIAEAMGAKGNIAHLPERRLEEAKDRLLARVQKKREMDAGK